MNSQTIASKITPAKNLNIYSFEFNPPPFREFDPVTIPGDQFFVDNLEWCYECFVLPEFQNCLSCYCSQNKIKRPKGKASILNADQDADGNMHYLIILAPEKYAVKWIK